MTYTSSDNIKELELNKLRCLFNRLCAEFPDLELSMSLNNLNSSLILNEANGEKKTICIKNIIDDSTYAVFDVILTLKQLSRKFDD